MEENRSDSTFYTLPYIVRSSFKIRWHILFIVMTVMFIGVSFIPMEGLKELIARIFAGIMGLFFGYCWIYFGVLKRGFVILNEEEIRIKTPFASKKLKWTEIAHVETFCRSNNTFIGIMSNNKMKKRKDNLQQQLVDSFGGSYSLIIPLSVFSKVDPEKLYATIFYTAQRIWQINVCESGNETGNDGETINKESKVKNKKNNLGIALLKGLLVSLVFGVVYGLLIYVLNVNLYVIPVLGMVCILYIYMNNYQEKSFNVGARIILGVLCAIQVFIALLIVLLIANFELLKVYGGWYSLIGCTLNIIQHPGDYSIYYIFSICFFFLGVFFGYSSKTTRKIKKLFMRKQNGYYISREKRYISIYLIDYADYDENAEKTLVRINPNVCLIEKKKKLLGLYIPEEVVEKINFKTDGLKRTIIGEKVLYKLDLGGHAQLQPYGYTCQLVLNHLQQIELIQLEVD